jgi:hypothetical protein
MCREKEKERVYKGQLVVIKSTKKEEGLTIQGWVGCGFFFSFFLYLLDVISGMVTDRKVSNVKSRPGGV